MEKWDEHYWSVLDDVLEDYSLQFEPKVEFMEKSFFSMRRKPISLLCC